ncbi:hypothetical protein GGQ68_000265 [Sagittula marina]|uniref:Uncharacterized protein n=1 Tax=Sagittula marina TaxID=943940 RepID=A0A7W6DRR3_9RHOB|nr:hypothetical protein [Sagittula marina]
MSRTAFAQLKVEGPSFGPATGVPVSLEDCESAALPNEMYRANGAG